jgi:hypothetical protein
MSTAVERCLIYIAIAVVAAGSFVAMHHLSIRLEAVGR